MPDTTTTETAPAVTPNDARRLVAAALQLFIGHWTDGLATRPLQLDTDSVTKDIALAHVLTRNTTGWTHTTRLREFLEANQSDYATEVDALDPDVDDPRSPEQIERDQAQVEYDTALATYRLATEVYNAAGHRLVASQCGVHYATTPSRGGSNVRHLCTLAPNRDGDHGKYAKRAPARGAKADLVVVDELQGGAR